MLSKNLIFEEVKDAPTGGSSNAPITEAPKTVTAIESTIQNTDAPSIKADAPQSAAVKAAGDSDQTHDSYGYKIQKPGEAKETKTEAPKVEEKLEDIKDPASGYGVKPLEEPKAEDLPKVEVDPAKIETPPIEVDLKGLGDKEAAKLKDFFKEKNIPKEAAQEFANLIKSEMQTTNLAQEQAVKAQKIEEARIKAGWDKELRTDPAFGGDNYAKNLHATEKVLRDFLPNTKKELTARGSMLPPYVMRDLAKLSEHLYGSEKFVQGEQSTEPKEEPEASPLDFYSVKK
jgi:hypothetical protein